MSRAAQERYRQLIARSGWRWRVVILTAWVAVVAVSAGAEAHGDGAAPSDLEQREAIAEQRLEEMLEGTPAAITPGRGAVGSGDDQPAADTGQFPQVRVPLGGADGTEPDVEVAPNPPPAPRVDPVPPPYDADERGIDPLTD